MVGLLMDARLARVTGGDDRGGSLALEGVMDDERFHDLIRRTFDAVRELSLRNPDSHYSHFELMDHVEREIRAREIDAVVNRQKARIALVGPGGTP